MQLIPERPSRWYQEIPEWLRPNRPFQVILRSNLLENIPAPLDWVTIGSGGVLDKYISPAIEAGELNVTNFISLEEQESFARRYPQYEDKYTKVSDQSQILEKLAQIPGAELNIMIVTPAKGRVDLVEAILLDERLQHARIYIEKPYASSREDIEKFEELVRHYSERMHFATRFSDSRSDILINGIPTQQIPTRIECHFIEGDETYQPIRANPRHYYRADGPESDLGFHLLQVTAQLAQQLGGYRGFRIESVQDLHMEDPHRFEELGFGVRCNLTLLTEGHEIPVELVVGKGSGEPQNMTYDTLEPNEKGIDVVYPDSVIRQYYFKDHPLFSDPIYQYNEEGSVSALPLIFKDNRRSDYTKSFWSTKFGRQSMEDQLIALDVAKVCFQMKAMRTGQRD